MLTSSKTHARNSNLPTPQPPIRIGAVSYLNSKPLIEGLADRLASCAPTNWDSTNSDKSEISASSDRRTPCPLGVLTTDLPSRLADQLHRQELDIGLIPVFESFRNPSFTPVSDAGVVSRGPVWSVRLLFRKAPKDVRTLALDEGSRTSAALSKVLLHEELGFVPDTLPFPIGAALEDVAGDAVLIIGDRAMHPENFVDAFPTNWDLGETWWQKTGLPFVFARWIARDASYSTANIDSILRKTRDFGVTHVPQIAQRIHGDYELSSERCQEYLTDYIHFVIDDAAQRGLDEFRRRCKDLKLVDN